MTLDLFLSTPCTLQSTSGGTNQKRVPKGANFHPLPPDVQTVSQVQVHRDQNVSTLHSLVLTPHPPTSVCLR